MNGGNLALLDIFGKKDARKDLEKKYPFLVTTEWVPYKLYAKKRSSSTLYIRIKNLTKEVVLTSLALELPNKLGFEDMGLAKEREIRLGEIGVDEERELKFNISNSLDADKGEYTLVLAVMAHYRDYGHVMNMVRKRISVQVV